MEASYGFSDSAVQRRCGKIEGECKTTKVHVQKATMIIKCVNLRILQHIAYMYITVTGNINNL